MSEIDPQPESSGDTGDDREIKRRTWISGCMIVPFILLSLLGLTTVDLVPRRGAAIAICIAQIAILALCWYAITKARSWREIVAMAIIAAGFYLLLLGICSGSFG